MSVYTAKARAVKSEIKKDGVVGVGIGYKKKDGEVVSERPTVVVLVEKKKPLDMISSQNLVADTIDGYKTDVMEVGHIRPIGYYGKERPAVPGISMGHYMITAGTFGCIVYKQDGFPYILSNNHVLANTNNAKFGDPIYQPGPIDGGGEDDVIGYLEEWIPIGFGEKPPDPPPPNEPECPIADTYVRLGNAAAELLNRKTRIKQYAPSVAGKQEVWENIVDCAIARPTNVANISNEIKNIGVPEGTETASLGLALQKTGRTTEHTFGTVQLINATIHVDYGGEEPGIFVDQIVTDDMSRGGDSGSLVLTRFNKLNAVGLLFAGSSIATIINPIEYVQSELGVSLVRR